MGTFYSNPGNFSVGGGKYVPKGKEGFGSAPRASFLPKKRINNAQQRMGDTGAPLSAIPLGVAGELLCSSRKQPLGTSRTTLQQRCSFAGKLVVRAFLFSGT